MMSKKTPKKKNCLSMGTGSAFQLKECLSMYVTSIIDQWQATIQPTCEYTYIYMYTDICVCMCVFMYTKHMHLTLTSARWRSLRRSREKEKNREEAAREKQDQATKTTSTTCQEHYDDALFACIVNIKVVAILGVFC